VITVVELNRSLGGPLGFGEVALPRSDDESFRVDLDKIFPSGIAFLGTAFEAGDIWVNTNGTLSLGGAFENYPTTEGALPVSDVIGVLWSDVDTRLDGEGIESGQIWYDIDALEETLTVTWDAVGSYRFQAELTNSFQLEMRRVGTSDFDLTFRFERVVWTSSSAIDSAQAISFISGTRLPLPIALPSSDVLDTALGSNGLIGEWIWQFRNGVPSGISTVSGVVTQAQTANSIVTGSVLDDLLRGGQGNDTLRGEDGNDWLFGSNGADVLNGGAGDDFIFGGTSDLDLRDVIYGADGNDSIDAGYGNDLVYGGAGNDTIAGGFGVDELFGQDGNDVITGSAYSDLIFGGAGDDFLNGGFGFDRLNGGAGADRFFHIGISDHGSDWIQDYSSVDGDVLVFGGSGTAQAADFQINFADTPNAGIQGVSEAFVIYKPSGQILWALVDGESQTDIFLRVAGVTFDIL
jgi:serralysin